MPSMYQRVPYIAFQRGNERWNPSELKAYGRPGVESDPCQGKLQKDLDYAHISMYATIGVRSTYVRGYRVKSHVYHFSYVFRDDQGNIKGQKMAQGV